MDGVSSASGGADVRCLGRLRRPPQPEAPVVPWRRSRLTRRRDFVWRRAGGARVHAGPARRMGHAHPHLLRDLRCQPACPLQRDIGGAVGRRNRKGEIFRRHADPDKHRDRHAPRPRGVPRAHRRTSMAGRDPARTSRAASAVPHLRHQRQRDDQRHAAYPET